MLRQAQLALLAATVWVASGTLSFAQDPKPDNSQSSPAPCSVIPQPDPCGSKPATPGAADKSKKPSASEKFPFPGEPASSSPAPSAPGLNGVPQAPDSPTPNAPAEPASKKFPFPGESSKPDLSAPGASSSSSSSSSSSDDAGDTPDTTSNPNPGTGNPGLKDAGSSGNNPTPGRHILHRVNPPGTKLQSPEEREAEDLDVAHFYMDQGDLAGAYLRGKDAVKIKPDDPDAHFLLAEVAARLNKRDEAIAEYSACLKLDPDEKQAKDSRKALTRLQR